MGLYSTMQTNAYLTEFQTNIDLKSGMVVVVQCGGTLAKAVISH